MSGAYAGIEARYLDRLTLRVLRYDNRADPSATDAVANTIAWDTRFTSAGVRAETSGGWTGILQWLQGETTHRPRAAPASSGRSTRPMDWFRAASAAIRLSARYDHFNVEVHGGEGDGAQSGHAWTAAYAFEATAHWRICLEWVQVHSQSYDRQDLLGGSPWSTQTQVPARGPLLLRLHAPLGSSAVARQRLLQALRPG